MGIFVQYFAVGNARGGRVVVEVPGISAPEGNPLMGPSRLGKVTGLQILESLLLLLCLFMFAAALFLWYLAW